MAFGRMSTVRNDPMRIVPTCLALLLATVTSALAASPAERRGKAFAKANCARCHAIDRTSTSPNDLAPPFRMLHLRYPVETLAEAFAEGIYTGHAAMPAFELEPRQINDLLAYFKSLE
jgi:mono/diheme cytochrome c family protein